MIFGKQRRAALATGAAVVLTAIGSALAAAPAHADDYYPGHPLTNYGNGLCLDDSGQGGAGSTVIQWECNSGPNQLWYWAYDHRGRLTLRNGLNDLCLDINQGGGAGTGLILWYCNDGDNQVWTGDIGISHIINPPSGLALDNPGGSGTWGRQMIVWYQNGGGNQLWDDGNRLVLD